MLPIANLLAILSELAVFAEAEEIALCEGVPASPVPDNHNDLPKGT